MLEQIVRRKFYLQRHLYAPLLKERESFLSLMHDRNLAHQTLLNAADYLLHIVEYLHLTDDDGTLVSIESILIAANEWSHAVTEHPMKRREAKHSDKKFVSLALDFLSHINRLDVRFCKDIVLNRLFSRKHFLVRYLTYPLFNERTEFIANAESKGAKLDTLRSIAQYQIHLIDLLNYSIKRPVSMLEIQVAARVWQQMPKNGKGKEGGSKLSYARFMSHSRDWLSFMGMLEIEADDDYVGVKEMEDYLNWMFTEKGCSQKTIKLNRSVIKSFLKYCSSVGVTMNNLSLYTMDKYIGKRQKEDGCKRKTISNTVSILRTFLKYCSEKGWCPSNIHINMKSPRIYQYEDLPSFAPWEDVQNILRSESQASGTAIRNYAILLMLSVYGLRCSEITDMRLSDIDWWNERILLKRAKGCRPQILPLQQSIGNAIIRYVRTIRQNESHNEYLFLCSRAPYRKMSTAAIYRIVSTALKNENLKLRHYGPHSLRHSCATHLVNNGCTLKEVADLLGHQLLDTTRIYAKVNLSSLRKVSDIKWEEIL